MGYSELKHTTDAQAKTIDALVELSNMIQTLSAAGQQDEADQLHRVIVARFNLEARIHGVRQEIAEIEKNNS